MVNAEFELSFATIDAEEEPFQYEFGLREFSFKVISEEPEVEIDEEVKEIDVRYESPIFTEITLELHEELEIDELDAL